jgi:hypothetical protein
MEEIWQISGLSVGRFLTLNIREQAKESRAFAARPYTVSVGMATGLDIFNVSSLGFDRRGVESAALSQSLRQSRVTLGAALVIQSFKSMCLFDKINYVRY